MGSRIHSFHFLGGGRRDEPLGEPIDSHLADSLRRRLIETGHGELASKVDQLRVVDRCRCGEPGCESFYTVPARELRRFWGRGGKTIALGPGLAVDIVEGEIVAVEKLRAYSE
jgi:hypothetical protein